MEDGTTTDAPVESGAQSIQGVQVDDQGTAVAQPEQTEPAPAVEETTEQPAEGEEEPSEPSADDTSEWLKNKGIDPSDPEAINKLAKSAREAERAMHSKAQKASELEKTMTEMSDASAEQIAQATGQDPEMVKRIQRIEVRDAKRTFFENNPGAAQYEGEMAKIATESGLYGTAEAIMKAAYAIARSQDIDAVKSQAKRETLEGLAHKQQAAVPTGNAVSSGNIGTGQLTPQNVDQMVANMSAEEYRRRIPEINRAIGAA
jgi:plasmid maintenance system antidote protein VapI